MSKYKNAKHILPHSLLKEVQAYIQGELLYIPQAVGCRRGWGEKNGYRQEIRLRNHKIVNHFQNGLTVGELANNYALSEDAIRKIIYTQKS